MIIIYRTDNGEITRLVSAPEAEAERNVLPGEAFILAEATPDWQTQRVADGQIVAKAACPAALDGDRLTGLPVPSLIVVQSALSRQSFYSAQAEEALSFAYPGDYKIWVQAPGYLTGEFAYTKA